MTQPVTLPLSEVHTLHSKHCDVDFQIYVQRPVFEGPNPLPVVISTDANYMFGAIADMSTMLLTGGETPPTLNIGIGYPPKYDGAFVLARRTYDFSPAKDPYHQRMLEESGIAASGKLDAGGAPNFFRFVSEELWPWVKQHYKTSDDRTLIGHSMGGLFGFYVLFNHAGFFQRYAFSSPWLAWADPVCFDYEKTYAAEHKDLDAALFMASGDSEHVTTAALPPPMRELFVRADIEGRTKRMGEMLASRKYKSLRLKRVVGPDANHFTSMLALIPQGLRFVFRND